ncbi:MAG: hypothetical protein M3R04_02255 [bacterium]|nr:hypothetical protein [bacterium]
MSFLRYLYIPLTVGLLLALAACPKAPDTTTVSVQEDASTPSTTIVEHSDPAPPAETNVDVNIDTTAADEHVTVVSEEVRTKYPEVVTVVERTVSTPVVTDNTIYVADAPGIKVWTTKVIPATAPADVVYRVRDFNVSDATDTELKAEGYVLVASGSPDFVSERKYVNYTFRKDATSGQWLVWDLDVTRTEPATPEDIAFITTTTTTTTETTDGMDSSSGSGSAGGN